MNWKRYAATLALTLVATPVAAQVVQDVEEMSVDIDEAANDLESNVPKVEPREPITMNGEQETQRQPPRADVRVRIPYLYPVDAQALDDGRLDLEEIVPTEEELPQPGAINPQAGPTINPQAGPTIDPDAGPTINPQAGPTINPDAEPFINPSAGRQIDPDELQKVDDVRANVTALQQRLDRNFRDLRSRRLSAFENGEPFAADAYDGVAEDLSRLEGELSDLEAAYQGAGDAAQVATLRELQTRAQIARRQLSVMRNARTPNAFRGAADAFGAQVGAISHGGATLVAPGTPAAAPGAANPAAGAGSPSAGTASPPSATR